MSEMPDVSGNLEPTKRSKYRRPRRPISWIGLVLGLVLGISSGLVIAWVIAPVEEFDTEPWQLNERDKAHYMVAITLSYAYNGDLNRAIERLLSLRLDGDPIQRVADVACSLATTGYVDSSSGLRAIRSMMQFYQLQGRRGCADTLIPVGQEQPTPVVDITLPTPTLAPPPSKTPTPQGPTVPTPTLRIIVPTTPPQQNFVLVNISTFCDVELSGVIEVFVQDFNGEGIPGQPIRVRWDAGENTFFTGLKPERGPAYADFQMEAGKGYTIEMPGRSDPSREPLVAVPCTTEDGQQAITSYRAVFRPAG